MSYNITRFNGDQYATIADGTVNTTLDITLIGKNYAGYGVKQNENFLYLLEHFANVTPPPSAKSIGGQLWFNSSDNALKINLYDGTKWKTLAVNDITSAAPSGRTQGDLWYDTTNNQLNVLNGAGHYTLVGPQSVTGFDTTQMQSVNVQGHPVQNALVNGHNIFTISSNSDFSPSPVIAGFPTIYQGVTLNSDYKLHGTATNADTLGPAGHGPDFYAPIQNPSFPTSIQVANAGVLVGPALRIFNDISGIPTIKNNIGDTVIFQTTSNTVTNTPLKLVGNDVLPGTNSSTNLGSSSLQFYNIWANYVNSTSARADSLAVGSEYKTASKSNGPNTIVVRDGQNINATRFVGKADDSTHADQADNATHADRATNADQADLVTWNHVTGRPNNFVFSDRNAYDISINGNSTGLHTGDVTGDVTGKIKSVQSGNVIVDSTYTPAIFTGSLSGNATTASRLLNIKKIQGQDFNGTVDITVVTQGTGIRVTGTQVANDGVLTINSTLKGNVTGIVTTSDNATVTNTMLAGSISNNKLLFSKVTVNGTDITLGESKTITAAAGTLTGDTLNSAVKYSSLNSVGTLTSLTVTNRITGSVSGSATSLSPGKKINGEDFDGTRDITVTADAGTLTGSTLKSTVTNSSLTSVGTLTNLTVTNTITGSISGTADKANKLASPITISLTGAITGSATDVDGSRNISIATQIAGSTVPQGLISMWYGAVNTIPNGWALCDGRYGTPNLVDRFIVGAGGSYAVGATGGSATQTLSSSNLPAHTHNYWDAYGTYDDDYAHTFTDIDGRHPLYFPWWYPGTWGHPGDEGEGGVGHALEDTQMHRATESTGSGTAFNTVPPYYALCYIMKL
jgi:hypothetical protein